MSQIFSWTNAFKIGATALLFISAFVFTAHANAAWYYTKVYRSGAVGERVYGHPRIINRGPVCVTRIVNGHRYNPCHQRWY